MYVHIYTSNITIFHNVGTMIIVKVSNVKRKHLIILIAIAETKDMQGPLPLTDVWEQGEPPRTSQIISIWRCLSPGKSWRSGEMLGWECNCVCVREYTTSVEVWRPETMLLHNVKQHNVNVTWRNVTKRSCTPRKSSKTLSFQNVNVT
jgi:hypothetical protein